MGNKSYLSEQINLMTLTTIDLLTEEEYKLYQNIVTCINKIGEEDAALKENSLHDPAIRQETINEKRAYQEKLDKLIGKHSGTPREVQYKRLLDTRRLERDESDNIIWPEGITWKTLKTSRKISEFISAESRMMGLKAGDVTFDKIIIKWKSLDILKQIVLDGFVVPILNRDGTIEKKHHILLTASSGQLRTDKAQFMEENMWEKIRLQLMCGLTFDEINRRNGINANKLQAYIALSSSASIEWKDVSIDNIIVVDDFENEITEEFDNIDEQYHITREVRTIKIKQSDGIGMMLPKVSRKNMQLRSVWLKGLLTSFDFIKFCEVNNCSAVLTDIYGQEHDLIAEDIQVILFKSQFKLWKYYNDWNSYKKLFKEHGCTLNVTNIEEDYIPDTTINYQFLNSLVHMTDEEIDELVKPTHDKIENIAKNQESMLKALKADVNSENPYKRSLAIYPELLREAYTRDTLKDIKTRWLLDARSGKIYCENKRLFAIPDMYAICEYLFLHNPNPKGLLKAHEVGAKCLRNKGEMDFLRSPSLSMEHWIATVVPDQEVYNWFYTNGCYMNCHDSMIKRLQGDVDGDTLNCVYNRVIVAAAKRELEIQNVRTLNYDLGKASDKPVNNEEMFNGLKRAHEYSGIGQVSNNITKIWNSCKPDYDVTKLLCKYNNEVIDGAKSGKINDIEQYPDVRKRLNKAIGGKKSRMPAWFAFSKNARKELHLAVKDRNKYAKENDSTMNRICRRFDDIGNINFGKANVPPFNWQMLLTNNDAIYDIAAVNTFCQLDDGNKSNFAILSTADITAEEADDVIGYEFVKETIIDELTKNGKTLEEVYPSIVKYLFVGQNLNRPSHKQMFWRVFGEIAYRNLAENIETYTVCDKCGAKIPAWAKTHDCPKNMAGFYECVDCGAWCSRTKNNQIRCENCQTEFRAVSERARQMRRYVPRKKVS